MGKLSENRRLYLHILLNYLILLICVVGFAGGAVMNLTLPVFQIGLSFLNYHYSQKWQTVLMLQVHLLISTVLGLFCDGYLYFRYISNDAETILVSREMLKIGFVLVCGLGILTTLLKYLSIKGNKQA